MSISTVPDSAVAPAALSDDELVERVQDLAASERRASVALIRSLMEFDARRLYLREGCSSLFTYCTQVLHLSEGAAYNRIETARAARRYAKVFEAFEPRRRHADRRPPARATFDARQSWRCAGGGTPQHQAGDSGADCLVASTSGGGNHHPAGGTATTKR